VSLILLWQARGLPLDVVFKHKMSLGVENKKTERRMRRRYRLCSSIKLTLLFKYTYRRKQTTSHGGGKKECGIELEREKLLTDKSS